MIGYAIMPNFGSKIGYIYSNKSYAVNKQRSVSFIILNFAESDMT